MLKPLLSMCLKKSDINRKIFPNTKLVGNDVLFHSPNYTLPHNLDCQLIITIHDISHVDVPQHQSIVTQIILKDALEI